MRLSRHEIDARFGDVHASLGVLRIEDGACACEVRIHGEPEQVLLVRPRGLLRAEYELEAAIDRIAFERGPALWAHEARYVLAGQVYVNAPCDATALCAHVAHALDVRVDDLALLRDGLAGRTPPFALTLPASLHDAVTAALGALGIAHHEGHRPPPAARIAALRLGATVLVAHDFEIEIR